MSGCFRVWVLCFPGVCVEVFQAGVMQLTLPWGRQWGKSPITISMKTLGYFLFALMLVAGLSACNNDDDGNGSGNNPDGTPSNLNNPHVSGTSVEADFFGRITDKEGNPISGAVVQIASAFAQTDNRGFYSVNNVSVDSRFETIRVQAGNYYNQFRNVRPRTNDVNLVDIRLIPRTFNGFFQANAGGEVTIEGGGSVVFPANGMVDEDGNAYNGQVIVAATYLDPTDLALATYMPGSTAAVDDDGQAVGMISYGMIGVDILSSGGQPLQLADGAMAQIGFPVQDEQMAHAPDQIPLWHFDEVSGVWHEEGSAVKEGNMYTGEVSHFSFWNCDIPVEWVYLDATFADAETNTGLSNLYIRLYRPDGSYSNGFTNADGDVSGIIPANEVLSMEVYDADCGTDNLLYSADIGPFSGDVTLDPISIEFPDGFAPVTFSGVVVDCDGAPLDNPTVIYESTETTLSQYTMSDENGAFNFSLTCATQGEVDYIFQNLDELTYSNDFSFSYDVTNETDYDFGEVVFCESFDLETFLTYEDGQNAFAYGAGDVSESTTCATLFFGAADTSQTNNATVSIVYLDGIGTVETCSGEESIFLSRTLADGRIFNSTILSSEVTITSFEDDAEGIVTVAGTITGSSQVNIWDPSGANSENYEATAAMTFQYNRE